MKPRPRWRAFTAAWVVLFMISGSVQANVFGDGNPENGIEDTRTGMLERSPEEPHPPEWFKVAGVIECSGQIKGSATLVNLRALAGRETVGPIIVTSAHVLWDMEAKRLFEQCVFSYQGLSGLPGYQVSLNLKQSLFGDYNPDDDPAELKSGEGDWAFLSVRGLGDILTPEAGLELSKPNISQMNSALLTQNSSLIAYDTRQRRISISTDCGFRLSTQDDIGGGAWAGQLLDDCDSDSGASGGGLVQEQNGKFYLVGIRSGSHWQAGKFPDGPVDGAKWDMRANTNFARAIDESMLKRLQHWLSDSADKSTAGN